MKRAFVYSFLGCLFFLSAYAQESTAQQSSAKPPEKCAIEGGVVDARTGAPLRKADLMLRGLGSRQRPYGATTDAGGRFAMRDIEPGKYRLWVSRRGYVRQEYGSRGPNHGGQTLTLAPGQHLRDIVTRLTPQGVIAGRVIDEDGDPVSEVNIQALRYSYISGGPQLSPGRTAKTNDLGEYRLYGLVPGRYYVRATYRRMGITSVARSRAGGNSDPEEDYAPTYYPGTNDPSVAVSLEITAGSEVRGIDLTLLRTPTFRVRGRIVNTLTNGPKRSTRVMLFPRNAGYGLVSSFSTSVRDQQGTFEIRSVTPGSYYLTAYWMNGNERYSARQPVDVANADIEGVDLAVTRGPDLIGHVRIEGTGGQDYAQLSLYLRSRDPAPMGSVRASVENDSRFVLQNVPQGDYTMNVSLPKGFYLKSIRMGDEDVLESGLAVTGDSAPGQLEVVLSSGGGQIDGVVVNERQQPARAVQVALVPDPRRRRQTHLYKTVRTDQYGRFAVSDIAPGDYNLFVWEDIDTAAYQDPEFLKPFEKLGEAISIRENSRETTQLKLIPAEGTTPAAGLGSLGP
jgi:hypothetical protein